MPHRCFHHPPVLILSSAKPIEPKKCPVNHAFSMPVRYCICSNLRLRSNLSIVVPISCHFSEYKNQPLNYFFFSFCFKPILEQVWQKSQPKWHTGTRCSRHATIWRKWRSTSISAHSKSLLRVSTFHLLHRTQRAPRGHSSV